MQKTLTDASGVNLLLLELSYFRNIVLSYFENSSSPCEITCQVFGSVQYKKTKIKGGRGGSSPLFPLPLNQLLLIYLKATNNFWGDLILPIISRVGSEGSYCGVRRK